MRLKGVLVEYEKYGPIYDGAQCTIYQMMFVLTTIKDETVSGKLMLVIIFLEDLRQTAKVNKKDIRTFADFLKQPLVTNLFKTRHYNYF